MGKTFRKFKEKEYQDKDSKRSKGAKGCLNNGSCDYCRSNRTHKNNKRMVVVEDDI